MSVGEATASPLSSRADWAPPLVLATSLGEALGGRAAAAAVAVAAARAASADGAAICCWPDERAPRPTLLASRAAREAEAELRDGGFEAAARGSVCVARLDPDDPVAELVRLLAHAGAARAVVAWLPPAGWRRALDGELDPPAAVLVRAERERHRSLAALLALELHARGIGVHVLFQRPGTVASRRALAGLEPGGPLDRRARRVVAGLSLMRGAHEHPGRLPAGRAATTRTGEAGAARIG